MREGQIDPSGLVKGWAIEKASSLLSARGFVHHFVDAGGDVQAIGLNSNGQPWRVGIRNPFKRDEWSRCWRFPTEAWPPREQRYAASTSITRCRPDLPLTEIVSLTVIGPSIYEADRLARPRSRWDATDSPSSPGDPTWRDTRLPLMQWRSTPPGLITMFDKLLTLPDRWLDRMSMYRLMIYYLVALLAIAVGLSVRGILDYPPIDLVGSAVVAVVACLAVNALFASTFGSADEQ